MKSDGSLHYGNGQAREVVKQFRKLCYKKSQPIKDLFAAFFKQTKNAEEMAFYSNLLNKAIQSIKGEEESKAVQSMFDFGGFNNAFANDTADDFELISFLVIADVWFTPGIPKWFHDQAERYHPQVFKTTN